MRVLARVKSACPGVCSRAAICLVVHIAQKSLQAGRRRYQIVFSSSEVQAAYVARSSLFDFEGRLLARVVLFARQRLDLLLIHRGRHSALESWPAGSRAQEHEGKHYCSASTSLIAQQHPPLPLHLTDRILTL